jgi:hypothetical protein
MPKFSYWKRDKKYFEKKKKEMFAKQNKKVLLRKIV